MLGFVDDFGRAVKSSIMEGGSWARGEVQGVFVVKRSLKEMKIYYQGGKEGRQRGGDSDLEVEFWRQGISNQFQKLNFGWECGNLVRQRLGS